MLNGREMYLKSRLYDIKALHFCSLPQYKCIFLNRYRRGSLKMAEQKLKIEYAIKLV